MALLITLKKILSNYNGQTPSTGKEVEEAFNDNFEIIKNYMDDVAMQSDLDTTNQNLNTTNQNLTNHIDNYISHFVSLPDNPNIDNITLSGHAFTYKTTSGTNPITQSYIEYILFVTETKLQGSGGIKWSQFRLSTDKIEIRSKFTISGNWSEWKDIGTNDGNVGNFGIINGGSF